MGASSSRYCRPRSPRHWLIGHRVNDPRDGPWWLAQGASGLEIDVTSDGVTWFVNHDAPRGCTVAEYMAQMHDWPQWPELLYVDIKTPRAANLSQLYMLMQPLFPETRFIFSTARGEDAVYLLRLPVPAVLCVDYTGQEAAQAVFAAHRRRFWLADGRAAGLKGIDAPGSAFHTAWPECAEGRVAWTYMHLATWETDVVRWKLDATLVTAALLPEAVSVLQRICDSDNTV